MFGLLGAVLVAVIEVEWESIISLVRFTEYWSGRAIVQVHFAEVSSCNEADRSRRFSHALHQMMKRQRLGAHAHFMVCY